MKTAKISQTIPQGHEIEVTRIELWSSNGKKRIYFDVIDVTDNIKYEGVLYCIAEGRYHAAGDREGLGEWVWAYMQERYAQKKENGGYLWQKFNHTNSTIRAIEERANNTTTPQAQSAKPKDLNTFLKNNGYKWQIETMYGWEYDERGSEVWRLYAPDGRIVTIEQAIAEISNGVEVEKAKAEAQAKAAAELKAKEEAEQEAKYQAAMDAKAEFDSVKQAELNGMQSISNPKWNEAKFSEVIFENSHGVIKHASYQSKACKVVIIKTASDDIYTLFEISDTPEVESEFERNLSQTLSDFFG